MKFPRLSTILVSFIALAIAGSLMMIAYQNRNIEELVHLARDENAKLKVQIESLEMDNQKLSKKLDCISQILVKDREAEDIKRVELENCVIESEKVPQSETPSPSDPPAEKKMNADQPESQEDAIRKILNMLGLSALIIGFLLIRKRVK